jgi:4-coumarate--CoA ligase
VNFHGLNGVKDQITSLRDIKEFVDDRVSPYKRLRGGVFYLGEIPKNTNGKVLRRLLPRNIVQEGKDGTKGKLSPRL